MRLIITDTNAFILHSTELVARHAVYRCERVCFFFLFGAGILRGNKIIQREGLRCCSNDNVDVGGLKILLRRSGMTLEDVYQFGRSLYLSECLLLSFVEYVDCYGSPRINLRSYINIGDVCI